MRAEVRICFSKEVFIKAKKDNETEEVAEGQNLELDKKSDQAEAGSIQNKLVAVEAMLLQNWAQFIVAKLREQSKD